LEEKGKHKKKRREGEWGGQGRMGEHAFFPKDTAGRKRRWEGMTAFCETARSEASEIEFSQP